MRPAGHVLGSLALDQMLQLLRFKTFLNKGYQGFFSKLIN